MVGGSWRMQLRWRGGGGVWGGVRVVGWWGGVKRRWVVAECGKVGCMTFVEIWESPHRLSTVHGTA